MRERSSRLAACAAIGLVAWPASSALGNAGSPIMMLTSLHLVFGNAFFGVLEGLLIARLCRASWKRAVPIMILANYVSAIMGSVLIVGRGRAEFRQALDTLTVYHVWETLKWQLLIMVVLGFVLTLVIEWPFCLWTLKNTERWLKKSIAANLLAQTVSYAVMVPLGTMATSYDVFTAVDLDPTVVSQAEDRATIYFVDPDDGDLYRIGLNGTGRRRVKGIQGEHRWIDLVLRQPDKGAPWQLCRRDHPDPEVLITDVGLTVVPVGPFGIYTSEDPNTGKTETEIWNRGPYSSPIEYRPDGKRDWQVRMQWWLGVQASNDKTGDEYRACLDTPLVGWTAECGTLLPDDQLVFEMDERVFLLEVNTRRLGQITRGRSPVVILHTPLTAPASRPTTSRAVLSARTGRWHWGPHH